MIQYKDNVKDVLDFLDQNNYSPSKICMAKRCFNDLEQFLVQEQITYTPEAAQRWLNDILPGLDAFNASNYGAFLRKLQDLFEIGGVRKVHSYKSTNAYALLSDPLKTSLDEFIIEQKKRLASATVKNHWYNCSRFLIFSQENGAEEISEITYDIICRYDEQCKESGKNVLSSMHASVALMMQFFYDRGELPYGFTIVIHYLSSGKGCYWNHVDIVAHSEIQELMTTSKTVPLEKLKEYKLAINGIHQENDYSKSVRSTYNKAIDLLILFLDMNGYRYNPEISMVWYKNLDSGFIKKTPSTYRALCLTAQYHATSNIQIETVFLTKLRAFDLLPEWSREAAGRYLKAKTEEGWARSTLDMIRSSICRFCGFLDKIGVRSFRELEVGHVKQFNANDMHKTPASKNAYNTRLRRFLCYLGEKGYLSNPMLFLALPSSSAPKETVVVVLTEDEMAQLNSELANEDSKLSLRKKAMLLLGLKMGMRSSDIVKLKISDIDWNSSAIRFVQNKTQVEVTLPMPTEVGNALFRYITEERHRKGSPDIFLSERAPYRPVGRSTCYEAIETALPDRDVEGSGFHVARKTFATELLRNGVGIDAVANALGQTGTTTVHRYLSLDADRMRMCALSLEECGIGGWHNGK